MASKAGGLVQEQSSFHIPESSVARKISVSKALRKGGIEGRTPLRDLSNSVKPSQTQAPKKLQFAVPSTIRESGELRFRLDTSKKKRNKALEKGHSVGRKALTDISNSVKPQPKEKPKDHNLKLNAAAAEKRVPPVEGHQEQFLHDHSECIKNQNETLGLKEFMKKMGLEENQTEILWPETAATTMRDESPPKGLVLEEMPEYPLNCGSWRSYASPTPDSPPYMAQLSPERWSCYEPVNFTLIESP